VSASRRFSSQLIVDLQVILNHRRFAGRDLFKPGKYQLLDVETQKPPDKKNPLKPPNNHKYYSPKIEKPQA